MSRRKSSPSIFDAPVMFGTEGHRVAAFIERYCRHSKGEWAGDPIALEAWQRWALAEIFRTDPANGYRQWRTVLLLLPRKCAKSTIVSACGHYLLGFDGEGGPEGYSGAWGTEQASITLDAAKAMRDMSPTLKRRTTKYAKQIALADGSGTWKVVSKIADLQQGTNPHFALLDEYHVHQRSDLFDAFKRGTQARRQPLILIITTEADDPYGPLGVMQAGFGEAEDIEQVTPYLRVARDWKSRSLMIRWGLQPGEDADIENPDVVRGCNPAGWLDPQRLIDEYLRSPGSREQDFRRYHLNQLVSSDDAPITEAMWDACRVDDVMIPDGAIACSATDLGFTGDWSAHILASSVDDRVVVEGMGWQPPSSGEINIRSTVDAFARGEAGRLQMLQMLVDKWNARQLMQDWESDGLPVGMYSGESSFMCPASVTFYEAVKTKRLAHNGDPELRRQVLNLRSQSVGGTAWKFVKHPRNDEDDRFKTDMGLAAVAAVHQSIGAGDGMLETYGIY